MASPKVLQQHDVVKQPSIRNETDVVMDSNTIQNALQQEGYAEPNLLLQDSYLSGGGISFADKVGAIGAYNRSQHEANNNVVGSQEAMFSSCQPVEDH